MTEQFYTIMTNIGKASIANASALGSKVDFQFIALGDGNGEYYNPGEAQTELRGEVWRGQVNHVEIEEDNPNWVQISAVIPATVGGFSIREIGIFDTEGNMLAIGKYPETYKPTAEDGSTKDLVIRMVFEVGNASAVTLKIDPTVILATQKDVDTKVENHNQDKESHPILIQQLNEIKTVELPKKANKIQQAWIAPELLNGWRNYEASFNDAGYYKDEFGVVHLRGFISSGVATTGTTLFILPEKYRPSGVGSELFSMPAYGMSTNVRVVASTGAVVLYSATSSTWLSLSGISFKAGD